MSSATEHPRPLAGIRVLDLTRVLAGPYCTMLLADLGAEVVKVERPDGGDDARLFGPFLPTGLSAYFASINRGKRSITLDLKSPPDRETFLSLARAADVVVENFRAGTMQRLGLGPETLREHNPQLVYASLSGFGHEGQDVDRAAYDIVVQALSGLMSITGPGPGEPVKVGTSICDIITGVFGAVAINAALQGRQQRGQGSVIDLAMLDCAVAVLENAISRYTTTGVSPEPLGTRHPSITPFQSFATADGSIVLGIGNDTLWRKLCDVLDQPDLVDDPRFRTNEDRTRHVDELAPLLSDLFAGRPAAEWLQALAAAGIPSAPIRSIAEVVADTHLASRDMWKQVHDGGDGTFLIAGSPFRMDGRPAAVGDRAPELGEHNEAVLREWLNGE